MCRARDEGPEIQLSRLHGTVGGSVHVDSVLARSLSGMLAPDIVM